MSKKKEYIAIISEGEKTEKQIINNLENNFTTFSNKIIFLSYKANIYNLFIYFLIMMGILRMLLMKK